MTASFSDTDGNYSDSSGSDGPVTPSAAASSTVVADNAATTSTGGTLVFTATVSGPGGTPAGTVAWTGSACSSTTDLSAGVATCSITDAQASSSYSVTASFSDTDGNYSDSSGSDGPVTPSAAASSTVVADNAATTSTGGTLVFTATVSGPGGTPAGTVAWTGSACSSTTDLSAGVATCSITDAQASSSYSVTASFSDTDGNYSDSSGSDGPVTPSAAASSTVVADNAATTSTGGTLVFTATVSGPGGTPAGTVAWTGSACSSTTDLSAGVATCSITDAQASSSYSVTASFSDTDGNYSDSSGSDGPVTPAAAASSTVVADNAATTSTGGTLVFTATVSGPGGTPAGTVAWTGSACSSTTDLSAGVATCSITDAQASSSYSVTASFSDTDGNYSDSSGSDGPVTPAAAASSTVVADNAATTSTGGTLVFTATVSGPGGTPAGTVAWTGSACSSTTDLSAGVATCSITDAQASSSYSVTASFSDTDGNYSDSSGSDGPVTPAPANQATLTLTSTSGTFGTVLTLTTSGGSGTGAVSYAVVNGTASGCAITSGQLSSSSAGTCLVTATKAADANYNATSSAQTTVTLAKANQATLTLTSTSGTFGTVLTLTTSGGSGTGAVSYAVVNGTASGCAITSGQLSSSSAGTCLVTATKAADANYNATSSAQTTVTLAKANQATLTLTSTSGTFGTVLTLTTSGGSGTGAVSYAVVNGTASGCAITSGQLSSSSAGTCLVTATKAADANYNATSSAQTTVTLAKAAAPFSITVNGSSSATITYGSSATLTEAGLPAGARGTVAFFTSSNASLCSFTDNGSTTSCATSTTLATGTYSGIYATFVDTDGSYIGSTSTNTVSLTVNPAVTTTVVVPSTGADLSGTSATLDATASAGAGINKVQFVLTGGSFNKSVIGTATLTAYGYILGWNSTSVPGGTYTLQSLATDNIGNTGYSPGITITVDNTPPSTAVVVPSTGADLSGTSATLDATASASYGVGITTVQFVLTGGSFNKSVIGTATPTAYGYIYSWNTTSVPGGTYTLQSLATDGAGNTAYSTGITVTVDNTPPSTAVVVPSTGSTLTGTSATLDATASASFGVGITKVQFVLTGGSFNKFVLGTATLTAYGYIYSLNTTTIVDGTYTLQSLATDGAGNTAYSAGITIRIGN